MNDEELKYTDKCMVGCFVALFFKKKLLSRIKEKSFQFCKIKAGLLGRAGNKGAVCLRF